MSEIASVLVSIANKAKDVGYYDLANAIFVSLLDKRGFNRFAYLEWETQLPVDGEPHIDLEYENNYYYDLVTIVLKSSGERLCIPASLLVNKELPVILAKSRIVEQHEHDGKVNEGRMDADTIVARWRTLCNLRGHKNVSTAINKYLVHSERINVNLILLKLGSKGAIEQDDPPIMEKLLVLVLCGVLVFGMIFFSVWVVGLLLAAIL